MLILQLHEFDPFFVEQVVPDLKGQVGLHSLYFFARHPGLDAPEIVEGEGLHRANYPASFAMFAKTVTPFFNGRTHFLAGDLHQAEAGDPADINLSLIPFHSIFNLSFHLSDIALAAHINEIHHNQTTQIPQA